MQCQGRGHPQKDHSLTQATAHYPGTYNYSLSAHSDTRTVYVCVWREIVYVCLHTQILGLSMYVYGER